MTDTTIDLSNFTTAQLASELRSRGLPTIIWQPGDMVGYGDPSVPLEDRLEECRKSLEDQCVEAGWTVIDTVLGQTPMDDDPMATEHCDRCHTKLESGQIGLCDSCQDEKGQEFRNHYRHCGQEWSDTWSCKCNDRCPICNREIEPYDSEELTA